MRNYYLKTKILALEEGTCIQKASENPFVEVEGWEQLLKENSFRSNLIESLKANQQVKRMV